MDLCWNAFLSVHSCDMTRFTICDLYPVSKISVVNNSIPEQGLSAYVFLQL